MIAKKDVVAFKEFKVARDKTARGPVYGGKCWGKLKPGVVLTEKAARNKNDCDKGIHAWKTRKSYFEYTGSNQLWKVVIPAGTWYNNGDDKYRADAIRLVIRLKNPKHF